MENDFINKVEEIIEENLSHERFGVSELAREAGMSRSNLLRKIKKVTKLSASQYIRQIRLKKGMEMLRQTSFTVSEIAYKVGFGSTSYFIKCFHDYYGYPPGEVGNRDSGQVSESGKKRNIILLVSAVLVIVLAAVLIIVLKPFSPRLTELEKSIAVLPFKNDSNDSTNVYIINGLMESILDNLQKIEDLRVTSRTSVEKYRNNPKTIPEIAEELDVNYLIEGSGQKIGDKILLNVQLIDAASDKHIWSEQYNREAKDIFKLQMEVATNIADQIEVIITPEVKERINTPPTDDLIAYDYFLQGLDLLYTTIYENLEEAITLFEKAIEQDNDFARAYAVIAITYYFLDLYQAEKKHSARINHNADKALLLDPQLPQSLIAKALFYMNNEEYESAVAYFEKALEYNPNYDLAIGFLADVYVNYIPDTKKYLEYALRGIKIDITAYDSITASIIYLHISNAFMQSGFINEAEMYINRSLEYDPENLYSEYVKAYILYAKNRDLQQTKKLLIETLDKDSTRWDILQETGKICYYLRDFTSAYMYYEKFIEITEALNLDVYQGENGKIGVVMSKMGLNEDAGDYLEKYLDYAENDRTIYKHLSFAAYYSFTGDTEKAIEHLELFSQQDNYQYWILLFLEMDPLVDNIKDLPEFKEILSRIEIKFWNYHEQIRASLEEKDLL
ncbi:MAG: helix-turn-helix domain-containing protein [Bacteroidales bacterium]|nr:MAG: helix-turn-helix domain-containing protein [Bacteroidales bacterium]